MRRARRGRVAVELVRAPAGECEVNDKILAYNSLCGAQACLERAMQSTSPQDGLQAMTEIHRAVVECRSRMVGFAFPELFPREMPPTGTPLPEPKS